MVRSLFWKSTAIIIALAIASILLPGITPTVYAELATIYVDADTGDDMLRNGTESAPYKTFTKGYSMTPAGGALDLTGTFTWTDAGKTHILRTRQRKIARPYIFPI